MIVRPLFTKVANSILPSFLDQIKTYLGMKNLTKAAGK